MATACHSYFGRYSRRQALVTALADINWQRDKRRWNGPFPHFSTSMLFVLPGPPLFGNSDRVRRDTWSAYLSRELARELEWKQGCPRKELSTSRRWENWWLRDGPVAMQRR